MTATMDDRDKPPIIRLISWYCKHSPLAAGKPKLQKLGMRLLGRQEIIATSIDGRQFALHMPEDASWYFVYYTGTFETGTLEFIKKTLRPDDVVLDIGGNIGWYTVHVAPLIPAGRCHTFEPVPMIFEKLKRNCALNGIQGNVTLNNCALGAASGTIELHTFPDLPHGHSSISTLGRTNYATSTARMITLDSYLAEGNIPKIDLIKIDVEGAEKMVFAGAGSVLRLPEPPIWVIELNTETSESFGYAPSDLLKILQDSGDYDFYRVVRGWDQLVAMKDVHDYGNGDNAVCVPACRRDRMRGIEGMNG